MKTASLMNWCRTGSFFSEVLSFLVPAQGYCHFNFFFNEQISLPSSISDIFLFWGTWTEWGQDCCQKNIEWVLPSLFSGKVIVLLWNVTCEGFCCTDCPHHSCLSSTVRMFYKAKFMVSSSYLDPSYKSSHKTFPIV